VQGSFSSLAEFAALRGAFRTYLGTICPREAERLFVALNEAVNNALVHGNKEDVGKQVRVRVEERRGAVVIKVRDEGEGFAHRTVAVSEDDWQEDGRGLFIIRQYTDGVKFNVKGNEIVISTLIRTE